MLILGAPSGTGSFQQASNPYRLQLTICTGGRSYTPSAFAGGSARVDEGLGCVPVPASGSEETGGFSSCAAEALRRKEGPRPSGVK